MPTYSAGEAEIRIVPGGLRQFAQKLRGELQKINVEHDVAVNPDLAGYRRKLREELAKIRQVHKVKVEPDFAGYEQKLREGLRRFENIKHVVQVEADTSPFRRQLAIEQRRAVFRPSVRADLDYDVLGSGLSQRSIESDVVFRPDSSLVQAELLRLRSFNPSIDVRVDADVTPFRQAIRQLELEMRNVVFRQSFRDQGELGGPRAIGPGSGVDRYRGGSGGGDITIYEGDIVNIFDDGGDSGDIDDGGDSGGGGGGVNGRSRPAGGGGNRRRRRRLRPATAIAGAAVVAAVPALEVLALGASEVGASVADLLGVVTIAPAAFTSLATAVGVSALAFKGVGDALKGKEGALEALTGNAQKAVIATKEFYDDFQGLRDLVQENFFEGADTAITEFGNRIFPALSPGLGQIATSLGGMFKETLSSFGSDDSLGDLSNAFGNTATFFDNLKGAIDPFRSALTELISVGSNSMPRLGDAITDVSERFNNFIQRASETGDLDRWIDRSFTAFADLGASIGNISSMLASIFRVANGDGQTFLGWLREITEKGADFLKSFQGQNAIATVFREARETIATWKPILGDIIVTIGNIISAVRDFGAIFTPILAGIADFLREHEGLVRAVVTAYLSFKVVTGILGAVTAAWGRVSAAAAPAIAQMGAANVAGAAGAWGTVAAGVRGLATALGPTVLIAALVGAYAFMESGADRTKNIATAVETYNQSIEQSNERLKQSLAKSGGSLTSTGLDELMGQYKSFLAEQDAIIAEKPTGTDKFRAGMKDFTYELGNLVTGKWSYENLTATPNRDALEKDDEDSRAAERLRGQFKKSGITPFEYGIGVGGTDEAFKNLLYDTQGEEAINYLQQQRTAFLETKDAAASLALEMQAVSAGALTGAAAIDAISGKLQGLNNDIMALTDAQANWTLEFDRISQAMQGVSGEAFNMDGTINAATTSGAQLWQQMSNIKAAYGDQVGAAVEAARQQKLSYDEIEQAGIDMANQLYNQFITMATAITGSEEKAKALAAQLGILSGTQVTPIINTVSIDNALAKAKEVTAALLSIGDVPTPSVPTPSAPAGGGGAPAAPAPSLKPDNQLFVPRATGGPISGPGSGTSDSIPAMLSNGEYVINAASTARYRPLVEAINAGKLPGYAGGGIVDSMASTIHSRFPDVNLVSGYRTDNPGQYHDKGKAGDFAGPSMGKAAAWIAENFMHKTLQLIHSPFNHNITDYHDVGDGMGFYGPDTMAEHENHLHWAVDGSVKPPKEDAEQKRDKKAQKEQDELDKSNEKGSKAPGEGGLPTFNPVGLNGYDAQGNYHPLPSEYTVQGIGRSAATIGINALLGFFGLENSILSETNEYNQAISGALSSYDADGVNPDEGKSPYDGTKPDPRDGENAGDHQYIPGGGAEQWRMTVEQILGATGRDIGLADITVQQIQIESGGDPNAVNMTDSNAAAGTPSIGLLQIIQPTFDANADPMFPGTAYDPEANIAAGLNYADAEYGGPSSVWPTAAGYSLGGPVTGPGGPTDDLVPAWLSAGEFVVNAAAAQSNLGWLSAINSGLPLPSMQGSISGGNSLDRSINIDSVHTIDPTFFRTMLDRWQTEQTMALRA